MPKLDFDLITMGHGSGGLLTHRLLESGVFTLFKNEHLDQQHDGAVLHLSGRTAFTTDSYVISPIFFPGGNIGDLAVNGSVNDLAMCGAIPNYLSLSFILEEGLRMEDFWEILISIKLASGVPPSKGCALLTLKKPPPLVPNCLIAICEAAGPIARVCFTPSKVVSST